jgi:hypothetical protein
MHGEEQHKHIVLDTKQSDAIERTRYEIKRMTPFFERLSLHFCITLSRSQLRKIDHLETQFLVSGNTLSRLTTFRGKARS